MCHKSTVTVPSKKVLFLITKATWGGAQRYVFDLATHLGEEFEPFVAYGQPGKLSEDLVQAKIQTLHIKSLQRDVSFFSDIESLFAIRKCMYAVKPDVIHLNSSKAAALGALAARLCGVKKIVFTAHGWPFKEDRDPLVRALIHFLSWFTSLLSDTVIVVSKSDEEIGKRMWFIGNKIRYVPIGIESPAFMSREEATVALSISTNKARIVTIAELTKNKGFGYAIEAIAELKQRGVECEYFIIGNGELSTEIKRRAQELHVTDEVHFLGFLPGASKYLKAFDLFLLPSIKEGMPYVLLEAAFADLPIVTTSVIDPSFEERYSFIRSVPPKQTDTLASAIQASIGAQAHYHEYPSLERALAATTELY